MLNRLTFSAVILLGSAALAQMDLDKVEIKVHPVAGTVHMLEGAGGNIGVSVGEDGIVIVDTQFAPLAPKIKAALAGISQKPLRYVLNTHHHGDHVGGNLGALLEGSGSTIVAHENVRKRMIPMEFVKRDTGEKVKVPVSALPVITFTDSVKIHLNGEEVRALHLPKGHTDGDSAIFFHGSKVLHLGDHFFAGGKFPFIDLDGGGSVKGYIENLERVLKELPADWKIIPGHGPISTPDDLKAFVTMLKETRAAVEKGVKAKKTAEQLKKEKVLAKWSANEWQFISADRFIDTLHRDITGQAPAAKKK